MNYSNQLDLDRFFYAVRDEVYVIVKLGDFPNYYPGSDIDIFCYDKEKLANVILQIANDYIVQGFTVSVGYKGEDHAYIDFFLADKLDFRFDLYQSLPDYQRVHVRSHYIYSVVENAQPVPRCYNGMNYSIYVPSDIDECLLRYLEYIEWYELRPDKIKHLEYIMRAIADNQERIGFLDKLHLYTELPLPQTKEPLHRRIYFFRWLEFWWKKFRTVPVKNIPSVIWQKITRKKS